jgi:hypothetical protein
LDLYRIDPNIAILIFEVLVEENLVIVMDVLDSGPLQQHTLFAKRKGLNGPLQFFKIYTKGHA